MPAESDSIVVGLLRRARNGDGLARDELFAQCRNYVNLIARAQVESWMRSKMDASDLVQQTLLEAHRGFADFQGGTEAEWLAWLRQILTHNTHDFIRRFRADKRAAGREQPLERPRDDHSTGFFGDVADQGPSPSKVLAEYEREIELSNAIAELPADYQEVIMLRNLQRLPFDQVAERMERSRPAVQMLWMRAVRKLEETLRSASI